MAQYNLVPDLNARDWPGADESVVATFQSAVERYRSSDSSATFREALDQLIQALSLSGVEKVYIAFEPCDELIEKFFSEIHVHSTQPGSVVTIDSVQSPASMRY